MVLLFGCGFVMLDHNSGFERVWPINNRNLACTGRIELENNTALASMRELIFNPRFCLPITAIAKNESIYTI